VKHDVVLEYTFVMVYSDHWAYTKGSVRMAKWRFL
jgi:hypothetical protein